ncbi:MAG: prepilin-type N-terminal cleavage/methylation domain-containing protein [Candidatus Omnitrophica bacterium]|nr:prepilin-type N-terminal cleavage/methylation domain-containing protein [Candidatus Omnitrophota bacterium]
MFNKKGFTLLELIIVIVVIGILASIALPRYMRVAERARATEAKSMLSAIRNAQARYHLQHLTYGTRIGNLDIEIGNMTGGDIIAYGKYFSYETFPSSGMLGKIALAVRNDFQRGELDAYAIWINQDGDFYIDPEDYEYLL